MWEKFKIQNIWLKWTIRILIIAHFGAFSCGGCGDTNISNNIQGDCMNLLGQSTENQACCDSNGNAISPPPTGCPGPPSGSIGGDTTDPATESIIATSGALQNAEDLIGGDKANDVGSDLTTLAATSAPGEGDEGSAITPSSQRIGDPNLSIPEAGLNSNRSGRGGGGGAPRSSGDLGGAKSVKGTLPALSQDGALAEAQRSLEGDTSLAAYAGGGAGAVRKPRGNGLFGGSTSSGGLTKEAVTGVKTKSSSFGSDAERDLAGVLGAAPEDYLARISQYANIFNVIAQRYRETSMKWALKDSQDGAKNSAALTSRARRTPASKENQKVN